MSRLWSRLLNLALVVLIGLSLVVASGRAYGFYAASAPQGSASRAESLRAVRLVFGGNVRAERVARCESKLDARAVSRTGDWGLFQLNRQTWDPARNPRARPYWPKGKDWRHVFDPVVNARVAYAISKHGTDFWTHWRWSARCWS